MISKTAREVRDTLWLRSTITKDGHWRYNGYHLPTGHSRISYKNKLIKTSRFSAHYYLGLDLDSEFQALHKQSCPYPDCWNPDCLYVGTPADNVKDQIKLGTLKPWGHI